jgi:hypothetical protein
MINRQLEIDPSGKQICEKFSNWFLGLAFMSTPVGTLSYPIMRHGTPPTTPVPSRVE